MPFCFAKTTLACALSFNNTIYIITVSFLNKAANVDLNKSKRKMNSTISDDLTRERLTLEAVKYLKNISSNSQNLTLLHKELLEINLSITAYIEESKKRLAGLRLDLAHDAKSSQRVVEILSDKCTDSLENAYRLRDSCLVFQKMSSPATPRKRSNNQSKFTTTLVENNNNNSNKFSERQQARTFIGWYKRMIDHERYNLALYLSDDAILEWFGRTIKTRKKVTAFLKYDMQCSRHDFTTVESIDKIQNRHERLQRKDEPILASPLHSPEIIRTKDRCHKRKLRSNCNSPEWAEGCQPQDETSIEKKQKTDNNAPNEKFRNEINLLKRSFPEDESDISSIGDGIRKAKRKCVLVTPPNIEVGQGDCLPSTSGTDSERSHDALNAQLPKLAVECNGYIEFTRTRNSRSTDTMKWERKCKVQISFSEDPLNVGEYIIWAIRYTDESKCRRNLLAAFEEVALKEEELKKV